MAVMSVGELRSFVLNNNAASLDVSQGDRTPLDYVVPQGAGADSAAVDLGWCAKGEYLERQVCGRAGE